jgi:hypothetical protein
MIFAIYEENMRAPLILMLVVGGILLFTTGDAIFVQSNLAE